MLWPTGDSPAPQKTIDPTWILYTGFALSASVGHSFVFIGLVQYYPPVLGIKLEVLMKHM